MRLEQAEAEASSYQPAKNITTSIKDKSLVMLVAPAATGKSFVINEIVKQADDFHAMPIFTTRNPRPDDDPRYFRIIPHTEKRLSKLLDDIEARQVVQYVVHPTTKRVYGTTVEDYPGKFNLLATLSGAVSSLQNLPFASTHVIGLTAEPAVWKRWFLTRYPEASEERGKRLKEAILSLEWLIEHHKAVHWTINRPNAASTVATSIINAVEYNQPPSEDGRQAAKEMLATAHALLE
jgi:guanylate kinase